MTSKINFVPWSQLWIMYVANMQIMKRCSVLLKCKGQVGGPKQCIYNLTGFCLHSTKAKEIVFFEQESLSVTVCGVVLTHSLLIFTVFVLSSHLITNITQMVFTKHLNRALPGTFTLFLPYIFILWHLCGRRCPLLSHRRKPWGSGGLGRWPAAETDSKPEKPSSRVPTLTSRGVGTWETCSWIYMEIQTGAWLVLALWIPFS